VPLIALSEWLACLHALPLSTSPLPKYRYASAGSLYPVQAYLHVKPQRVNGLEGGFYYYHPEAHRLVNVSDGVELSGPEVSAVYGVNQPLFEQAAFALLLVAQFQAITPIYGEQSRDFCLLEAGYMGQLLMETAAECNLGLCPLGGLGVEPLQAAFDLSGEHHLLHGFVGGSIDPAWTQQPPAAPHSAVSITDALRQYLSDKLPAYMVPVSYHVLESLPLNANGKVDRQALPTPASLTADMPFVAPRNDIEQAIVNIWQTVLELDQVSIHENFFEVGGNSLMLIQLLSQIRQTFQTELAIRDVFMAPTPAELAELLAAQPHEVAPPAGSEEAIIPIERQDAQAVLERLDDMSEEEVERLLHQTLADEEDPS
jgi:SagB-type dehydrogenase family enzyme